MHVGRRSPLESIACIRSDPDNLDVEYPSDHYHGHLAVTHPRDAHPASHELAMALVYIFVSNMGAKADLSGLTGSAAWFILACYVWVAVHAAFCLLGAYLLRMDLHWAAVASAANIGGPASAPIVAAHHNEKLVPASILMALTGYAIGNYGGALAAWLASKVSG